MFIIVLHLVGLVSIRVSAASMKRVPYYFSMNPKDYMSLLFYSLN